MCMISTIYQSAQAVPAGQWTPNLWYEFQQILNAVKQLDEKLGQKDCEDPAKAEWMRAVEARLARLEQSACGT